MRAERVTEAGSVHMVFDMVFDMLGTSANRGCVLAPVQVASECLGVKSVRVQAVQATAQSVCPTGLRPEQVQGREVAELTSVLCLCFRVEGGKEGVRLAM